MSDSTTSVLPPLSHLRRLTDDTGLLQFATFSVPNPHFGYTLDDNARGLLVAAGYEQLGVEREAATALMYRYLSFICWAQRPDGRFHNELTYDRLWIDEWGSEDSLGRTVWALGAVLALAVGAPIAGAAALTLRRALPYVPALRSPRARAYATLGLAHLVVGGHQDGDAALLAALADGLLTDLERHTLADWVWFEDVMAYDNGRLPYGLLLAGWALDEPRYLRGGRAALDFLLSHTLEDDVVVPIGQAGWWRRNAPKACYDQQPIDAASLAEVCAAAAVVLGDARYRSAADSAWRWFHGHNSEGLVLYDAQTGGCHDGLGRASINHNQGAESTLALLQAALALVSPRWLGVERREPRAETRAETSSAPTMD